MRQVRTLLLLVLLSCGQWLTVVHVFGHDHDSQLHSHLQCAHCVANPQTAPPPNAPTVRLEVDLAPSRPAIGDPSAPFSSASRPDSIRGPPPVFV